MLADFDGIEILDDCDLPRDREARMQEAFERSKVSYPSEQNFTEPGHFRLSNSTGAGVINLNGCEDTSQGNFPGPSNEQDSIAFRLRHLEYRLNDLYLRGHLQEALDLGLNELAREESSDDSKDGREQQILDLTMRCALHLDDHVAAVRFADKATSKYLNIPGLMATASELYLRSGEARKALPTILQAISLRGPLPPFLHLLYEIMVSLQKKSKTEDAVRKEADVALGELSAYVKSLVPQRVPLLRDDVGASAPSPVAHTAATGTSQPLLEKDVRDKASMAGLSDAEAKGLVSLLCRGSSTLAMEDIRSVKGL